MTTARFLANAVKPALQILPPKMDTPAARAAILAICLQESRLANRRQIKGPAKSYAMFEMNGIFGVLKHPASRPHAYTLCGALDLSIVPEAVHEAIEHNDILCAGFTRLLLYTLPTEIPGRNSGPAAWLMYLQAWRPGKPHPATRQACYDTAWDVITQETNGV